MELQQVIEKRQSIRKYKEGEISDSDIRKMVAAAGMAPSGKNVQNWHYIAVKSQLLKKKVAEVVAAKNAAISNEMSRLDVDKAAKFNKLFNSFTRFFEKAPVLFLVYSTTYATSGLNELRFIDAPQDAIDYISRDLNPSMQSLGASMENLMLTATNLGYGTCLLTSANYAAHEIERLIEDEIGFKKEGYFFAALIACGIPEDNQPQPKKKELDDILTIV